MLYIGIAIRNPFKRVGFNRIWGRWWRVPRVRYKNIELEFMRTENLLHVSFDVNPWTDHGGTTITLGLAHYELNLNFYDTRHWDRINNTWK